MNAEIFDLAPMLLARQRRALADDVATAMGWIEAGHDQLCTAVRAADMDQIQAAKILIGAGLSILRKLPPGAA
jgi:hypothetical protein